MSIPHNDTAKENEALRELVRTVKAENDELRKQIIDLRKQLDAANLGWA